MFVAHSWKGSFFYNHFVFQIWDPESFPHAPQPAPVNSMHVEFGYQAQESDGRTGIKKSPGISQLSSCKKRVFSHILLLANQLKFQQGKGLLSKWVLNYIINILNNILLVIPGLGYFFQFRPVKQPGRKPSTGWKLCTNRINSFKTNWNTRYKLLGH